MVRIILRIQDDDATDARLLDGSGETIGGVCLERGNGGEGMMRGYISSSGISVWRWHMFALPSEIYFVQVHPPL